METTDLKKTKIAGKTNFKFTNDVTFEIDDIKNHVVSLKNK